MDTDKVLTSFVSDALRNECLKALKKVWNCTEYEQLLEEAEVKADKKAESGATVNMQLRFEAVAKWLNQFEEAAGDNKVRWEQWTKNKTKDYTKIDLAWYSGHLPLACSIVVNLLSKTCEAAKADELLSPEEQIFLTKCSPLPEMCMEVCEAMGIDEALTNDEMVDVIRHLNALCLYIALRNELNHLTEQAERHNIHLKEQPEQQSKQQQKPKPMSKEQWAAATLEQKKQDPRGKKVFTPTVSRIFDAAVGDGRFIEETPTGYQWKYNTNGLADNGTSLMYFLYKAYGRRDGIPWTDLQIMFGLDENAKLKGFLNNLKHPKDKDGNERESWLTQDNPPEWGRPIKQFIDSLLPQTAE